MISLCVRYVALIVVVVFTEFTSTEREQLAFFLGKYENDSVVKDCVEVSSLFKDIETLKKINVDVYIKNRNKVILAFLNGISYGEQEMKKQFTLKTCVALEHLYGMSTKYFVAPMCFVNNIMQCQATQSRMCINQNGKTGPAGSYKTVSNWLVSQSTK